MNEQEESRMIELIKSQAEEIMSKFEIGNLVYSKTLEDEVDFMNETLETHNMALKFLGAVEAYKACTENKGLETELEAYVMLMKNYTSRVNDILKEISDFHIKIRARIKTDSSKPVK